MFDINKKNIKISRRGTLLASYLFLFFFSLVVFSAVTIFLYKDFYQAIIQSDEVLLLKSEVMIEDINMKQFEEVLGKLETKTKTAPEEAAVVSKSEESE